MKPQHRIPRFGSFHHTGKVAAFALLCLLSVFTGSLCAKEVPESARSLPVVADVDVVVVGGSSGAVAAAVEAAKNGAKVFLAAPRHYLGEDLCGSYRLWLEPGEKPATELAQEMFKPAPRVAPPLSSVKFTYTADKPASRVHKDTAPPSLLGDGKYGNSAKESVQFDNDVTLVLDLGKPQSLQAVAVLAYQRTGDFEVDKATVFASDDRKQWTQVAVIKNENLDAGTVEDRAMPMFAPAQVKTRYLKFDVKKTSRAKRMLLAEIIVEPAGAQRQASPTGPQPVTPMQVKLALDKALLQAGVQFLYGCYATELLKDSSGYPAGIVMANRSGRQAVVAKTIIDATERGTIVRMTDVPFTKFRGGMMTFNQIVVGGQPCAGKNIELNRREAPVAATDRKGESHALYEYRLRVPMKDASFKSFAAAEQIARDRTWTKEQLDASETPFMVPPDSFRGKEPQTGAWPGADKVSLDAFRPAAIERMFVLNGCADLSREAVAELLRPLNFMDVGTRIGKAAATLAKSQPKLEGVRLPGGEISAKVKGEAREVGAEFNPRVAKALTVPAERRGVTVLGEYDVVVVGGGTGGAPAAIAAGRHGAKTLLIEYLHQFGGVGTVGLICSYYHGNRVGFTSEIDAGLEKIGPKDPRFKSNAWNADWKSEWYRRELRKAGVDIWCGALGAGAFVENGRVKGVTVATPQGRGVVLAKMVVDSTGNADIAAAAGATCTYTAEDDVAVQGTGLPPRQLGPGYTNTDYTFVDETDIMDIWRCFVAAREKFKTAYDLGQLIDTRERRQIVGDFTITPVDEWACRTFPDTVVIAKSNYDTHGYTVHPMFTLRPPHKQDIFVHVPYRCLLPRGLDGILVTGLGVSAHRDAIPLIRMQPDVQNQGYAAGTAAAMIARRGCATRSLDIKALQRNLIKKGILPDSVLTETDSFPMPNEKIAAAVSQLTNDFSGIELVLAQPDTARPLLRGALDKAGSDKSKLIYAHILAMLGDSAGAGALAKAVSATAAWDEGWQFKAMGQFGASISPLDSLIIALGRSRDPRALEPILAKARLLNADSAFSHFRAVSLALESSVNPAAAKPLAELLQKPGIGGYAVTNITAALAKTPASGTDNTGRGSALRELFLARALYRCGDCGGLGEKTLRAYAEDLHGHYARHAQAILKQKPGKAAAMK
ncbi:MAG: FAD-dependent oxidoreductase [Verrucomicrobia bacterium]|nr:FAD-dependent oxidoreductase [Verrucomicrobiota bacterium]